MPERCSGCLHPNRAELDAQLASNKTTGQPSLRKIAAYFGLSLDIVHRHGGHLPSGLVILDNNAEPPDLIERAEALYRVLGGLVVTTARKGDHDVTIRAVREARAVIELLARLGVAAGSGNVVDLHGSPEWLGLRDRILEAAGRPGMPPELRAELAAAITGAEVS